MATTVVDDMTTIEGWETATPSVNSFGIGGVNAPNSGVVNPLVQGTRSTDAKVTATGVGGVGFNTGSTSLVGEHFFMWARSMDTVQDKASHGWRVRLSSNTVGTTNYRDITVSGFDKARLVIAGFNNFCCNPLRSGENVNGTPPSTTAIFSFSAIADHTTATNRFTWFVDEFKRGTGITLTGGTVSVPGNSIDIALDDTANGRGTFKDISGIYYILGRLTIGDITAAVDSHFLDTSKVWLFEDQPVKNDFHKLEFVGGTGTNTATFGTEVGSGVTAVGVGGNSFLVANGTAPCYSLIATDADITTKFFGCTFINSLYEDHSYQTWLEDISATTFTDRTRESNITGVSGTIFPATEGINDSYYISDKDQSFSGIEVTLSTAGVGTPILSFEYWNGNLWTSLIGVVDGTNKLTNSGTISWPRPSSTEWVSTTVNGVAGFYMRIRLAAGSYSTNPVADTVRPLHSGDIKLENANVKAVSCLFSGCGIISIRNGAILRKSTITDSNAGAVGALDLGSVDPPVDTVRDLNIQNSTTGVLLKGTSLGTTTFNIRNFTFSGNTNDLRIDFPSTATVIINLLDGTSSDTPLILDNQVNVGGSTIVDIVPTPVTTSVNVKDSNGVALSNARVLLMASDATGNFPFEDTVSITRSGSVATVFHPDHGLKNGDMVVIGKGVDQVEYSGVHVVSGISPVFFGFYNFTVVGTPATPATGTIIATGAAISGLTDVNGDISVVRGFTLNQPVKGFVRKSSASPRFKTFSLAGNIINKDNGLIVNIRMISDE